MARTGQFIYLKTRGYLDIDRDTNQVRSFICLNTLISEDEGRKLIHEMKKKFAIMIQENEYAAIECDEPAVENPVQLERAILSLITNLHGNSSNCDENMVSSPIESYYSDDQQTETESHRSIKSPPLALIAPKSDTIKDSIQNSVKVIANAARTRTPDIGSPISNASPPPRIVVSTVSPPAVPSMAIISSSTDDENHKRPSVVQKLENCQKQRPLIQKANRLASPTTTGYISSSSPSASSAATMSSSSATTTSIAPPHQFEPTNMHEIKIKEEPISDFRVPPLPTSARYFIDEPTAYMMPSSSSESAYDYGDSNSDQSQPSQHNRHHDPSIHHRSGLISTTYNYKVQQTDYDPSLGRTTSTMLKRTHSYEMMDNLAKRRYPSTYSSGVAKL